MISEYAFDDVLFWNFTPVEQESDVQLPLNLIAKLVEAVDTPNKELDGTIESSLNNLITLYQNFFGGSEAKMPSESHEVANSLLK